MLDFINYRKRFSIRVGKAFDFQNRPISAALWLTGGISVLFLLTSSLKHALFLSSAWDMGIFDQAVYLISQGQAPISSFMGFHVLGDHAALILYPLALLYKIHVDIHWLFAAQAVALASGIVPTWLLARQAGLSVTQSKWIVLTYLLYPVLFSANQFHFHPEVFAVPAFLWAIWAARKDRLWIFSLAIAIVLTCKAVLSLTVIAMGIWLWKFEHQRKYGIVAIVAGLVWFIVATQIIIPSFGGASAEIGRHLYRYGNLGNSFSEVAVNSVTKPWIAVRQLVTRSNIRYLGYLAFPILWALTPQTIAPLIGAVPSVFLNLLSVSPSQKHLMFQYSLPVLPFVVMTAIAAFQANRGLVRKKWVISLCLVIGFVMLSGFRSFDAYLQNADNWQAKREAIALVPPQASLLTVMDVAPHLSQRPMVKTATIAFDASAAFNVAEIPNFEAVLLDLRHTGYAAPPDFLNEVLRLTQTNDRFQPRYQRDDVYLFLRKP